VWSRGSDNQRIHLLSELGQERYGNPLDTPAQYLQVHFDGDELLMISILHVATLRKWSSGCAGGDLLGGVVALSNLRVEQLSWLSNSFRH